MNGEDRDPQQQLPMTFYGKSYLGKDVSVPVTGESPTGVPSGGVAAIPASGAGPAAPQEAGPTAGAGPAGGPDLSALRQAMQGLDIAGKAANIGDYLTGPGVGAGVSVSPANVPFFGFDPDTIASLGGTEYGQFSTGLGAPSAGAINAPIDTGLSMGAGSAATAGVGLGQYFLSASDDPNANKAASAIGLAAIPAAAFFPPAALLATPTINALGRGEGLPGWSPPPASHFPSRSWGELTSKVQEGLPPTLPVPANATPEQKAQIERVNQMITELKTGYPASPDPEGVREQMALQGVPQWMIDTQPEIRQAFANESTMPDYLKGKQSQESWTNTMSQMQQNITSQFQQLADLYPKAQQALTSSYQEPMAGLAHGAPAGLIEAVGAPWLAYQQALQSGDKAAIQAALEQLPTDPAALMAQYAPQLQAAQELPMGFYKGEEQKKENA